MSVCHRTANDGISDYQLLKCRVGRQIWKRRLFTCLRLELGDTLAYLAVCRVSREQHNINQLKTCLQYVQSCIFNLKFYLEH